jgi:4-oxalocrotonate tautomerase
MPYVNVRITKGATVDEKTRVIEGITEVMVNVLGKNPKSTFVVIDEIDTDNWGIGGETLTEIRKRS